jgi:hypothetical protein
MVNKYNRISGSPFVACPLLKAKDRRTRDDATSETTDAPGERGRILGKKN